jgi:hypothetical protein
MENEIFNDILDDGERVIAVVRPNKKKYWAFFHWMYFFAMTSWLVPTVAVVCLAFWLDPEEEVNRAIACWVTLGIGIASWVIPYIISAILAQAAFKKRYYGYSNRRILIRCGIIGVDYKVLDYKLLGATTATVGVLDRMMGGKTGWLRFGSASSPITSIAGTGGLAFGAFTFAHVDSPYNLLKDIKKVINAAEK